MNVKRIFLLIILILICNSISYSQATGPAKNIRFGATDPATCTANIGQVFFNTTSDQLKICTATNTWTALAAGAGSGDFVGPASSTDNAVVRFDGTGGKTGQNSVVLIGDTGNFTGVGTLNTHTLPGGTSTIVIRTDNLSVFGSTTSAQLAGILSNETGTGLAVFNDTPTLIAPTLGVAVATSLNGLTITTSSGTFTLTNSKTLAVTNSLTLSGTDGTTLTFQGTGTYISRNSTDTLTGKTYDTAGSGNVFSIGGQSVTSVSGNTAKLVTTTGTLTSGDCVKIDASGNFIASGSACGGGASGITIGTTTITSGTATRLLYETSGNVVGEISNATSDGTTLTLTSPKLITALNDTNGNEIFKIVATGSAINEFTVTNAATGNSPILSATGGDTDINIILTPKGSGLTRITSNTLEFVGGGGPQLTRDGNYLKTGVSNGPILGGNDGDGFTGLFYGSTGLICWSSGSPTRTLASNDLCVSRNAAGVLEINSSSAGTFRDLKLRNLIVTGGQTINRTTTATDYTILSTDYIIAVTSTASARNITLPAASAVTNQVFHVVDESCASGTNNITVTRAGSDTFVDGGTTTKVISTNCAILSFYSTGSAWKVF